MDGWLQVGGNNCLVLKFLIPRYESSFLPLSVRDGPRVHVPQTNLVLVGRAAESGAASARFRCLLSLSKTTTSPPPKHCGVWTASTLINAPVWPVFTSRLDALIFWKKLYKGDQPKQENQRKPFLVSWVGAKLTRKLATLLLSSSGLPKPTQCSSLWCESPQQTVALLGVV